MNNEDEKSLRLLQLQFVGKILAGFTHEIKNYLAIIKESNGLIEDLISLGKNIGEDSAQYLEITRSIEEHIEKTNTLFRYLNRFAHRMDSEIATFNVNESLEELIALVTRFANQKKILLSTDFQGNISPVNNNPALFQFIAFTLLNEKMNTLYENSSLIVQTFAADSAVTIRIITEGDYLAGSDDALLITHDNLAKIMLRLGGNIRQENKHETLITLAMNSS